jgi:hypothetical protein
VKLFSVLYAAARADVFYESAARNGSGSASFAFLPTSTMASVTGTLEARLIDHFSVKLEYRHDMADTAIYFAGAVQVDPDTGADIPTLKTQDTVSLGVTAWF